MTLGRAGLAENPAGPTFGDAQAVADVLDRLAPPGRAQKFPEETSFKIALSSAWSATSFLSRMFSFSSSFKRLA